MVEESNVTHQIWVLSQHVVTHVFEIEAQQLRDSNSPLYNNWHHRATRKQTNSPSTGGRWKKIMTSESPPLNKMYTIVVHWATATGTTDQDSWSKMDRKLMEKDY